MFVVRGVIGYGGEVELGARLESAGRGFRVTMSTLHELELRNASIWTLKLQNISLRLSRSVFEDSCARRSSLGPLRWLAGIKDRCQDMRSFPDQSTRILI